MALGSVAARGAVKLYNWADSRYINPRPIGPGSTASTMVRTRRYRRTSTKKRNRKRRGIIRRRIPRVLAPRQKLIRLRTVLDYPTLTSTNGALAAIACSMFDITDPFVGLATNQPLGYDQIKNFYNRAYVVGAKCTIRVHNTGSVAIMYGVTPMPESAGTTTLTPFEHYAELPATKMRILSPDVDHGVLVSQVSTARHVHVSRLKDEDAFHVDLDNETPPTRQAYFHIWQQPLDKTTTTTANLVVSLEYLIAVYDPIIPARSTDT